MYVCMYKLRWLMLLARNIDELLRDIILHNARRQPATVSYQARRLGVRLFPSHLSAKTQQRRIGTVLPANPRSPRLQVRAAKGSRAELIDPLSVLHHSGSAGWSTDHGPKDKWGFEDGGDQASCKPPS